MPVSFQRLLWVSLWFRCLNVDSMEACCYYVLHQLADPGGNPAMPLPKARKGGKISVAPPPQQKNTSIKHYKCCVTGINNEYFITGQETKVNTT